MNTRCFLNIITSVIVLFYAGLAMPVFAGEISYPDDSYASGDTLTASNLNAKFNEIKADVNDNDNRAVANENDLADQDNRISDLETAYSSASFQDYFVQAQTQSAAECNNWDRFRAGLQPEKYTCVELVSSLGKGLTSCDPAAVATLAKALRDDVAMTVTIGTDNWDIAKCGGAGSTEITVNTAGSCTCTAGSAIRPCVGNQNWGGVGGNTCSQPDQMLAITFR